MLFFPSNRRHRPPTGHHPDAACATETADSDSRRACVRPSRPTCPARNSPPTVASLSSADHRRRRSGPVNTSINPCLLFAGVRLVIPDHAEGLPVLRMLSLCTCCCRYPGTATGRPACSFARSYRPSPIGLSDWPAHRPFRGWLGVHSRYGLHTRAVTNL